MSYFFYPSNPNFLNYVPDVFCQQNSNPSIFSSQNYYFTGTPTPAQNLIQSQTIIPTQFNFSEYPCYQSQQDYLVPTFTEFPAVGT